MPAIFNALPGIEVAVGAVSKSLADLWSEPSAGGGPVIAADDAKATQVNFVLHLGRNASADDAVEQFKIVERFAQRYPGRIVVLCPRHQDTPVPEIRAKVHGECFLGKSKTDKRCVEFVMLSYSRSARPFLESQVSICLSTDLPLYYWAHQFTASGKLADYRYLLSRAKRVLIDSSIAPADALTHPWPNPNNLRDLVYSRLLPVRQTIGQFLSRYDPALLIDGLRGATVAHAEKYAAEARVLLAWLCRRLTACGAKSGALALATSPLAAGSGSFAVKFDYRGTGRLFNWHGDLATGQAMFEADFGTGRTTLAAAVSLLAPEYALSEAMFF